MSEYEIFTNIQFAVLNMNIEDKIRLLNDCLTALNNVQEKQPNFKETITTFLDKNSCVLDSDSSRLLKYGLETFGIVGDEFLIENLQSAGKKRTGGTRGNREGLTTKNGKIVEGAPQQPVSDLAVLASIPDLDPAIRAELLSKILENEGIQRQSELVASNTEFAIVQNQAADQSFVHNLTRNSVYFSFTSPAALVYYLKSTLDIVGIGTINLVGKGAATAVGAAELGVRNIIPSVLNAAISAGRTTTNYLSLPTSVHTFLQGMVSSVRSTGSTEYTSESYFGERTRQFTSEAADAGEGTIVIGCIISYLALVLLLSLLSAVIINLYTNKRFKISFLGIASIEFSRGGKKTRKNRKNRRKRNHKKSHHKKKYKK